MHAFKTDCDATSMLSMTLATCFSLLQIALLLPSVAASGDDIWPRAAKDLSTVDASDIPINVRDHWMRQAIHALDELVSPCPFAAFGTVIVNHTSLDGLGEVVCIGVNAASSTGNPTLHGEIAGIDNCTAVLTDPDGKYRLSPAEALQAFQDLTLYTTAEPCPMCATAIRWAGFRECIFGTSIATLLQQGWAQIDISSSELFQRSSSLGAPTHLLGEVLTNKTDALFAWQYHAEAACPNGCERERAGGMCLSQADSVHPDL